MLEYNKEESRGDQNAIVNTAFVQFYGLSIRASYSHESVVDGGAPRGRPLEEVVELRLCDKVYSLCLLHDL